MDTKQLITLINHWRSLATEARTEGSNSAQPSVLRAHAYGLSDGLEMAANDILRILSELGEDDTEDLQPPQPAP